MTKDGKEGLLERSKRFLGSNKSLSPKPSGSDSASADAKTRYQRRRDQVRRAQRSHRERKENYIKALEQEILELRTNPSARIRNLQAQIAYLQDVVDTNGILLPEDWALQAAKVFNAKTNALAWFASQEESSGGGEIRVALPELMEGQEQEEFNERQAQAAPFHPNLQGTNYAFAEPAASYLVNDPALSDHGYQSDFSTGHKTQPENAAANAAISATNNLTLLPPETQKEQTLAAGVEFVLKLEGGCMNHLHEVIPSPTQSPGHVLTASHHILAMAPQGVNASSSWQVPEATLENLLALSTQFDLGGEITPVQAWHKLKYHPRFHELTPAHLQKLSAELSPDACCYGFGAVIEKSTFDAAVDQLFRQL